MRAAVPLMLLAVACVEPAPPPLPTVLRGHHDVVDGTPLVVGREDPIGLCVSTPPELDTSRWELSAPAVEPAARMATTLCFDIPVPRSWRSGVQRWCGEIVDRYDDARRPLECITLDFREDDPRYEALEERRLEILATLDGEARIEALAAHADAIERAGYPMLALRTRLAEIYFLRRAGSPHAAERLATLDPPRAPATEWWRALVAYERATMALERSWELRAAWQHLREAEEAFARIAAGRQVTIRMKQAETLARVGSPAEARARLGRALDDCERMPCKPDLVDAARNTWVWLVLQDPHASREALERALTVLDELQSDDAVERANYAVNRAYALARLGREPGVALDEARAELPPEPDARGRWIADWSRLIEAERTMPDDAAAALARCSELAGETEVPRLAAWAHGCAGRAARLAGDLERAGAAFDRALRLHGYAAPDRLGQRVVLGPGRLADDAYAAARVAVERGDPAAAWGYLEALDAALAQVEAAARCDDDEHAAERERLALQLDELDAPAPAARRAQRERIRRALEERLQELTRLMPDCEAPPVHGAPPTLDYRAFAVDDEILLLRRRAAGTIELYRRTPLAREQLSARLAEIERMMHGEAGAWRETLAPLAAALVPRVEDAQPVTRFALHGALQHVPLAALPAADGWLAERTVVALVPAGATRRSAGEPGGEPLFVVDPRGDLGAAREALPFYRRSFPGARLLEGARATPGAIAEAVPAARFVHFDAHASYDPAFPELSRLQLAGGAGATPAALGLDRAALEFVNLSACRSGRWPTTADSGRFGLAGEVARAGAPWVVGARADLSDALAGAFNGTFYRGIRDGIEVPEAHGRALRALMERFPPEKWAALLLLAGPQGTEGASGRPADSPEAGKRG